MADVIHATTLKILASQSQMACQRQAMFMTSSSAQSICALRVLRARGMNNTALQVIFPSTVIAKLMYAASAWSGFINMTERQRVHTFLCQSKNCGCQLDLRTFEEHCDSVDQKLFDNLLTNQDRLLSNLLPLPSIASHNYYLYLQ
jgi:hypothetical protein